MSKHAFLRTLALGAILASGPALAQDPHAAQPAAEGHAPAEAVTADGKKIILIEGTPHEGAPVEAAGHEAAAGEHAAEGHEAAAHGEGGHHGPHYSGDVDGDGTANWMDADADEAMGEGTYVLPSVIFHAINLAILLGALAWFVRPGVKDGMLRRAVGIRASVEEAAKAKAEAEARLAEVQGRLAKLEGEIAAMQDRARAEAVAEEARVAERAEEASRRIAETAQRQIADEATRARTALRAEAVDLAVKLAEGILRGNVGAGDNKKLAEQFLATLEGEA